MDNQELVKTTSGQEYTLPPSSLIICTRDRPHLVWDLVESILNGDELPTEIIVIDDSKMPDERLAHLTPARACELRYVWNRSVGLSRANNAGIALAKYELLVFTQDDALVAPDWFGTIVNALLTAGPESVVTGQVQPTEAEYPGSFAPSTRSDQDPIIYHELTREDVLYVQNMAMFRSVVAAIGGFDERLGPGTSFPAADDNDFALRLLEAGKRIIYVPNAQVYHRAWRTDHDFLPLRWSYGVARGGFYAKHLRSQERYIRSRMYHDVKNHLLPLPRMIRKDRQKALGDAVLAFGILYGAIGWWLGERKAQRA